MDEENVQGLCFYHHNEKTLEDRIKYGEHTEPVNEDGVPIQDNWDPIKREWTGIMDSGRTWNRSSHHRTK